MTKIIGSGKYLPSKIISNDDLSKIVETSDEWISKRTGIKERRFSQDFETSSFMASESLNNALQKHSVSPDSIDAIVVASSTQDFKFPSISCLVQSSVGANNAFCLDIHDACAGFVHAFSVADSLIRSNRANRIAVIGVDRMSSIIDMKDRNTCVLFGDGAGCVLIERDDKNESKIIDVILKANGSLDDILKTSEFGISMNGVDVFKYAISEMKNGISEILDSNNFKKDDLSFVFAHQANYRILSKVAEDLGLSEEIFPINLNKYGNTSSASIPIVFDENFEKLSRGDLIAMTAVGGGMKAGTILIKF